MRGERTLPYLTQTGRLLRGLELQGDRVHAVAQAGRARPVVEDVPQVPLAAGAVHLGADREEGLVDLRLDVGRIDGLVEARPAGAGLELGGGVEEAQVTGG